MDEAEEIAFLEMASSISIWEPQIVDGQEAFVRPDQMILGDHYSEQLVIIANKRNDVFRICLFGESAAAGYLLAPEVTPAKLISAYLKNGVEQEVEVIDFSRTNERIHSMELTISSASQLKPDLIIVWTGNNFSLLETPKHSFYHHEANQLQSSEAIFTIDSLMELRESAAREVFDKVAALLGFLDQFRTQFESQILLVVPEVNLKDWNNCQPLISPSETKADHWYGLYEQASQLMADQNWAMLQNVCLEMVDLDNWSNSISLGLLGHALLGMNDLEKGESFLRASIEVADYASICFLASPQVNQRNQEQLRAGAHHYNFALVDLPWHFKESGFAIPGKELFLDYCHMNLNGMQIAAKEIASSVLADFFNWDTNEIRLEELTDATISPKELSTTYFGTAIHTAHRHLDYTESNHLIKYWIEKAYDTFADVLELFKLVVQARLAGIPPYLTKYQSEIFKSGFKLLNQHGWNYNYIDAPLLDVLFPILLKHGTSMNELITQDSIAMQETIELVPFFLWQPLHQAFPVLMDNSDSNHHAFLRFPWQEGSFAFFLRVPIALKFILEIRSPLMSGENEIHFEINGKRIHSVSGISTWIKIQLNVKSEFVKSGINKLTIKWPIPEQIKPYKDKLPHPIYGEVFSVVLKK